MHVLAHPGCDTLHGHPGWANVVAIVIAALGVAVTAAIAIVRNPRFVKEP